MTWQDDIDKSLGIKKATNVKPYETDLSIEPPVMDIDFDAISRSSDFQRFIIFLAKKIAPDVFKGIRTRTTNVKMSTDFNTRKKLLKNTALIRELKSNEQFLRRQAKHNSESKTISITGGSIERSVS